MCNRFVKIGAFLVCLIMVFSSCNRNDKVDESVSTSSSTNIVITGTKHDNNSQKDKNTQNDIGGGDLGLLKYRMDYYNVPAPFANIIESDTYNLWYNEIALENPNETNVMVMKKFIQHFDISREDFDRANLEWAKIIIEGFDGVPMMNPQDFANQETDEVYNADIIYTFDDETINNYYLSHDYPFVYADEYEEAVANGTYETRTTDWVDIEQMEADIIAKYGEAEIVTEPTTAEQTETTTAKPPEATTVG